MEAYRSPRCTGRSGRRSEHCRSVDRTPRWRAKSMVIRALRFDELDALLSLYRDLFTVDEPLPARERVLAVWEQLQASPWHDVLGVELDGLLVASCTLTLTPNLTRATRPWGQIENVVTHRDYRRRGFGQALIK